MSNNGGKWPDKIGMKKVLRLNYNFTPFTSIHLQRYLYTIKLTIFDNSYQKIGTVFHCLQPGKAFKFALIFNGDFFMIRYKVYKNELVFFSIFGSPEQQYIWLGKFF